MDKGQRKNHLGEVAKMVGVEIGEEFEIKEDGLHSKFKFGKNGLFRVENGKDVACSNNLIMLLITGEYTILEKPWKADNGRLIYYPSFGLEEFHIDTTYSIEYSEHDGNLYKYGMMFCKPIKRLIILLYLRWTCIQYNKSLN